jgi:hypothetical protein
MRNSTQPTAAPAARIALPARSAPVAPIGPGLAGVDCRDYAGGFAMRRAR